MEIKVLLLGHMTDTYIRQYFQIWITDDPAGCLIISSHSLEDFFQRNLQIVFYFWQFIHYILGQKSKQQAVLFKTTQ